MEKKRKKNNEKRRSLELTGENSIQIKGAKIFCKNLSFTLNMTILAYKNV